MGEEAAAAVTDQADPTERDVDLAARLRDVIIVGVLLAAVTLLHQFTNAVSPTQIALHDFYRRLYYLPILYAAFRFGSRGGLVTALASVLLFAPHALVGLGGFFGWTRGNRSEIVLSGVVGRPCG